MRGAVGALAVALALAASSAVAQNYPEKPVRMLVPFPGGSATDLAARIVGQQLALALGQPFVIENRPGAGGSIAGSEVVRASPDGHTLLFSSNSAIASNVALLKNIPYDPLKDFTPVTGVGENMLVLMVNPSLPVKNLIELIAYAKERLASYKCPTSVDFIEILPRNPSGKVLKKDLREPFWAGMARRVN